MALTQTMYVVSRSEVLDNLGRYGRSVMVQRGPAGSRSATADQIRQDVYTELQSEEIFSHWYDPDMAMEFLANAILASRSPRIEQLEARLLSGAVTTDGFADIEEAAIKDLESAWRLFFMCLRSLNIAPYAWRRLRLVFERAWGASNGAKSRSEIQRSAWYKWVSDQIRPSVGGTADAMVMGRQGWGTIPDDQQQRSMRITQPHRLFPAPNGQVFMYGSQGVSMPANANRFYAGPWELEGPEGALTRRPTQSEWFDVVYTAGLADGYCEDNDCISFMPPWRWYLDLLFSPIPGLRVAVVDGKLGRSPVTAMFGENTLPGGDISLAEYIARVGPNELVKEVYRDVVLNNSNFTGALNMSASEIPASVASWMEQQNTIRSELQAAAESQPAPTRSSTFEDILGGAEDVLNVGETVSGVLRTSGATCAQGQVRVNGRCQVPTPTNGLCPTGFNLQAGRCVTAGAPTGSRTQQVASRTLNLISSLGANIPGPVGVIVPAAVGMVEMLVGVFDQQRTRFAATNSPVDCFGRPLATDRVQRYSAAGINAIVTQTTMEAFRINDAGWNAFASMASEDELTMQGVHSDWKRCFYDILRTPEGHAIFGSVCAWLSVPFETVPCAPEPIGGGPRREACAPDRERRPRRIGDRIDPTDLDAATGLPIAEGIDLCCQIGASVSNGQCVETPFGVGAPAADYNPLAEIAAREKAGLSTNIFGTERPGIRVPLGTMPPSPPQVDFGTLEQRIEAQESKGQDLVRVRPGGEVTRPLTYPSGKPYIYGGLALLALLGGAYVVTKD